jgi:dTDP-4-dehydrorhamnose reductase
MIHKSDRVVITGCGGMLGDAVYAEFKDICQVYASDRDLNVPWLELLDVSKPKDVAKYLDRVKPNYIVHLAALTDMEYCELHPDEAYAINTGGVENVAGYARTHNIALLYISTAGVFDGEKDEYYEHDTPNPLSVYGKSKYGGELVAKTVPKSIIIRAGWMMGSGPKKDKKFINKIIKQLRAGVKELAVVNDKFGTPCHTYDLAQSIRYLLDHDQYGIYHGACDGGGNRADVAREILKHFKLEDKIKIREVDSDYFKENYFATRPRSEKLINVELKKIAPHLTRDWHICLSEYLERFNWNLWDLNTSGMERSFYKNYFDIEKHHWLMRIRRAIVRDQLERYSGGEKSKRKVLDFGCGSGLFVGELAALGYESHGLDISSEAIKFGQLQGIKNLAVLDSHKINYPDNTFDSILILDVLEHLEDESWAMKEIERVLKPGGNVIIMVPAYMFLWGVQDEVAHHYRRYTKSRLLKRVRETTSLSTLRSSYFNTFLFLPITGVRLVSRLFRLKGRQSDFDINNEWMNKTFFAIFNTERKLLKKMKFPFGVSILAVLEKSKK